jgi:HEXXH motif-containing protein
MSQRGWEVYVKQYELRIPGATFTALATGGGGSAAVALLSAGQHSKHMLLIRGVMEEARRRGHSQAPATRRAYDLLATIQRDNPKVVDPILRHPSVGAWARRTILALRAGHPEASPEQLAAVAATAAIRTGTACDIDVPAIEGVVTLPSLGQAILCPTVQSTTVQCDANGAEVLAGSEVVRIPDVSGEDTPGWRGLRAMSVQSDGSALRVIIDDLDPYRMPGMANMGGRLTASEADLWQKTLRGAWDVLVRHHRNIADEVTGMIRVLTPLAPPPQGQSSATSRETFGCVALSTPPDAVTMAVTLAHETQHAKLSALLDLVPLTKPDDGSRFYAPWREDPRPVPGLLQGAYAYLGVTDFWRNQRCVESGEAAVHAAAEFSRWRASALTVTRTLLASGRLTTLGENFTATMSQQLEDWADETVSSQARTLARARADRHLSEWRARNS